MKEGLKVRYSSRLVSYCCILVRYTRICSVSINWYQMIFVLERDWVGRGGRRGNSRTISTDDEWVLKNIAMQYMSGGLCLTVIQINMKWIIQPQFSDNCCPEVSFSVQSFAQTLMLHFSLTHIVHINLQSLTRGTC